MQEYWQTFLDSYYGYASYLWQEVTHPHGRNYFYWLVGVSAFFFALELAKPWREKQAKFRKDYWLDFFYMFFNFFFFSLIIYNAASDVVVDLFNDFLALFGITNLVALNIGSWPGWAQLLTLFVVRDFIQWWVHRILHWVPWLWEFHKVHHSVEQMGFAAHLRFLDQALAECAAHEVHRSGHDPVGLRSRSHEGVIGKLLEVAELVFAARALQALRLALVLDHLHQRLRAGPKAGVLGVDGRAVRVDGLEHLLATDVRIVGDREEFTAFSARSAGRNPFQFGFIGSTDTHLGTPGCVR